MPRNDEGEFELVLGNRQLLSGFFIVVVLFGVFFNLGYIVGRHSSPAPAPSSNAATPEAAASATSSAGSPAPGQAQVMPAEQPKPETPPPSEKTAEKTEPVTATRPATAPPESPRAAAPKPPEPKPVATKPVAETRPASSGVVEPAPGSYLQVAAPSKGAAGAVVESLKNKGIRAVLAPGPNEATVRVLVGPLETSDVGKMRTELESAGFKPFSKRY